MKYLKKYETIKYIDDEHKTFINLAKRLEYNINKYINLKSVRDKDHVWVSAHYNHSTPIYTYHTDYDFSFVLNQNNNNKTDKIINYLKQQKIIKQNNSIYLSKEEAEKLLFEIKTDFIYDTAIKYNL